MPSRPAHAQQKAMSLSFQNAHLKFLQRSRTPPHPQSDSPIKIPKKEATATGLARGCTNPNIPASFSFHKGSFRAAFANRTPWPPFSCLITKGGGMGLFERTYLPDQVSSCLCGGPSRSLPCNALLVSITLHSSRPAARVADHCKSR